MAITLADVQAVTTDDIDFNVIDEARRESPWLLDRIVFQDTVSPGTGGGTLTTGYTRILAERAAHTRQQNTEYPAAEAKRERKTVDLIPLGARYNLDRVYANLGDATTNEVVFQTRAARTATIAKFADLFINGEAADFSEEVPGFDGLDAIVTGTIMESSTYAGGSVTSQSAAMQADVAFRAWVRKFVRRPDVFFVNDDGAQFLDTVNAWRSIMTTTADSFGQEVPTYGAIPYVNLGQKDGSNDPIIGTDGSGVTSIYGVCFGEDSVHGVSVAGGQLLKTWLPDFTTAGAVKPGEVELGPVAIVAKRVRGVGAFRVDVTA